MKKTAVAILAFFYLSISTGAGIHLHYCMGKLSDWGLVAKHDGKCHKCGMKDKDCCKDEFKPVKVDKDQKAAENFFICNSSLSIAHQFAEWQFPFSLISLKHAPLSHAPPEIHSVPLYILNCVYRV